MHVRVASLLWRRWNQATFDTLHGRSRGQYDIRLNTGVEGFFDGLEWTNQTELGGFDLSLNIAAYEGPSPVPDQMLVVRFMGEQSERRDWYIRAQRPGSAYPLWRPGRGVPGDFEASLEEFLVLIRDTRGCFHARWLHHGALAALSEDLASEIRSVDVGWRAV
jgi:hypothetical protein